MQEAGGSNPLTQIFFQIHSKFQCDWFPKKEGIHLRKECDIPKVIQKSVSVYGLSYKKSALLPGKKEVSATIGRPRINLSGVLDVIDHKVMDERTCDLQYTAGTIRRMGACGKMFHKRCFFRRWF